MTQTISGNLSGPARVIILNESNMVIESNTTTSGSYEIGGLSDGPKVVLARTAEGETFGYASVSGIVVDGIDIPYFNNFSGQTDQEAFSDPMWDSETAIFDASATSYSSTWTGGLVMHAYPSEFVFSNFYLRGDFTNWKAAVSPTGGWTAIDSHGIFLYARDLSNQNLVNIYMQRSNGNYVQVQSCTNGSWNYNVYRGGSTLEEVLKISRVGNNFYLYQGDTLRATVPLANATPDIQLRLNTSRWGGTPSQDYLTEYIGIEDATVTYPTVLDNFTGTNSNPVDSSNWTQTEGSTFINNNKARQIVGAGYNNNVATYKTALTGEFSVVVDWDLISGPSTNWWQSKFKVAWGTDKGAFIGRLYNGAQQVRRAYNDGGWTFTAVSSSSTTGQFMITRIDNTLKIWHNVGSGFVPYTVPVSCNNTEDITLSLEHQSSGVSSTWDWDNLIIIRE